MVANTETAGTVVQPSVIAGNERVLRARLADARFFWEQDRSPEAGRSALPALEEVIVFHARLGSMKPRRRKRIAALAHGPSVLGIAGADPNQATARRAFSARPIS